MKGNMRHLVFGVCIAFVMLGAFAVWVWRLRLQQHGVLTMTLFSALMLTPPPFRMQWMPPALAMTVVSENGLL